MVKTMPLAAVDNVVDACGSNNDDITLLDIATSAVVACNGAMRVVGYNGVATSGMAADACVDGFVSKIDELGIPYEMIGCEDEDGGG